MAHLDVVYPGGRHVEFALKKALIRIGRHSVNDLQLADDAASRLHAEIVCRPGHYVVRDLKSKNGVLVNDRPVTEIVLRENDRIQIGNVGLTFHFDEDESFAETQDVELIDLPDDESGPIVQTKRSMSESQVLHPDWSQFTATSPIELQNRLKSIAGLCRFLMTAKSPADLIEETMDEIIRHVPHDRGCTMLCEGEQSRLVPKAVRDYRGEREGGTKIAVSTTIAQACLRERSGVLCTDAVRDKRFSASESVAELELHSVLCVPLLGSERPLGIIHLESRADRYVFSELDLDFLMGVASELGVGLEHMELREERARDAQMALVGQTLAGLSGRIRRALDGAENLDRTIEGALTDGDLDRVRLAWETIRESKNRVFRLVDDMFCYSQSEVGPPEPGNVNDVVRRVTEAIEQKAEQRGIELQVCPDERVAEGYIVAESLYHALRAMALNALDAVRDTESPGVILGTDLGEEGWVSILIQDNGPGMTAEARRHVFEPFYSTQSGLGLAIARKLITDMGGKVACESEPGLGTTFVVTLPVHGDQPLSKPDEPAGDTPVKKKAAEPNRLLNEEIDSLG